MTAPTPSPAMTAPSPSSSPSAATSDGRPTLSSEPANEYLQTYDEYINDFKTAYEAMKKGDMTKYQTVIERAKELQTKGEKLGGELSPDEEKRFADYLNKKADELAKFASQNR
jgi:predicted PolB exonuclease-like 3'-5' exonuclease